MADTLTSSSELKLNYLFADGDTRATSLANPRNNLTAADVQSASSVLQATQAFVGDKNNGAFVRIDSAIIKQSTKRLLDLAPTEG